MKFLRTARIAWHHITHKHIDMSNEFALLHVCYSRVGRGLSECVLVINDTDMFLLSGSQTRQTLKHMAKGHMNTEPAMRRLLVDHILDNKVCRTCI